MKKILIPIAIIILLLCFSKNEEIIIPQDSIRFRVIANSNSLNDQKIKKQIVNSLQNEIDKISKKATSKEEAKELIQKEIPKIKNKINNEITLSNYNKSFAINYGQNYFPKKVYKGITYSEGKYESLVITLGEGIGDNFWCVLFPPLCNINENSDDVEYTSIVKEILNKYTKKA